MEEMSYIYNEWGEFVGTKIYKKCSKCGEIVREEKKIEEESTED